MYLSYREMRRRPALWDLSLKIRRYAAGLHTKSERNWIADYYCAEDDFSADCPNSKESFSLYLTSIYFAFTTMTTTGYGDILPNA